MPYIEFQPKAFTDPTLRVIVQARGIIQEYLDEGYRLTLRQLYYQFVARDLIPNTQRDYNRLGRIVSDARLAGMIDWDAIEDRTRNVHRLASWEDPSDRLASAARTYRIDKWARQPVRVEVWVEKEALAGVFVRICDSLQVPVLPCRGYPSQSEMWEAGYQRFAEHILRGGAERVVVLHFGDHDPSGIDMTRDIRDRLGMFMTGNPDAHCAQLEVRRVALNMDQVHDYGPPPNPAKVSDSRFDGYLREFGRESWELDALEPAVLAGLVEEHVTGLRDDALWAEAEAEEAEGRETLERLAEELGS